MHPQKILIVDDEKGICNTMIEFLQVEGSYEIDHAFDGCEGVAKYKKFHPDLVVMDISMPVMDGYESSRQIKSFDPSARILVVTGNTFDARARKTIEEGIALTLLQKPLRLRELHRIIQENLSLC